MVTINITERTIKDGTIRFVMDDLVFNADFIYPADEPGLVKNENKWWLKQIAWHSHRQGKKILAERRRPRYKTLGYFDTLEQCREFIATLGTTEE